MDTCWGTGRGPFQRARPLKALQMTSAPHCRGPVVSRKFLTHDRFSFHFLQHSQTPRYGLGTQTTLAGLLLCTTGYTPHDARRHASAVRRQIQPPSQPRAGRVRNAVVVGPRGPCPFHVRHCARPGPAGATACRRLCCCCCHRHPGHKGPGRLSHRRRGADAAQAGDEVLGLCLAIGSRRRHGRLRCEYNPATNYQKRPAEGIVLTLSQTGQDARRAA